MKWLLPENEQRHTAGLSHQPSHPHPNALLPRSLFKLPLPSRINKPAPYAPLRLIPKSKGLLAPGGHVALWAAHTPPPAPQHTPHTDLLCHQCTWASRGTSQPKFRSPSSTPIIFKDCMTTDQAAAQAAAAALGTRPTAAKGPTNCASLTSSEAPIHHGWSGSTKNCLPAAMPQTGPAAAPTPGPDLHQTPQGHASSHTCSLKRRV